jgi:N-methylhydantoinase B/oxoprolinase/acetone carboxylase alpha subunit|tara:strand:+ start:5940 stop:6386 length:447 start_codon:yes stop_codon:yes gene_type:complete
MVFNLDLDRVRSIASRLLSGVKDKAGDYVFWHASDMASALEAEGRSDDIVAVALLHDVFEDTDVTPQQLHDELATTSLNGKSIIEQVLVLTRQEGKETYAEYIQRVKDTSDFATEVKIKDLEHHLARQDQIPDSLVVRYTKALVKLSQ